MTTTLDLCLTWNWEHDGGFVELLSRACQEASVSLLQITPGNLVETIELLAHGQLAFSTLLDRSSEEDQRFLAVVTWAREHGAVSLNEYEWAQRAWNKAAMHRVIFAEVHTPYTIILPPCRRQPELLDLDLTPLRGSFTIKPAGGGGGAGVVNAAASLDEVRRVRQEFPDDEYLLQTRVVPARLGYRPGWFRVLYCCGEIFPCWWATDSHGYAPVTLAEESHYGLAPLRGITDAVARICKLELFSTEVALNTEREFLVVDYANDPIDLRLQSRCREGVPDDIVRFVAEALARTAATHRRAVSAA